MAKNSKLVPEARAALDRFKMEAAADVGVSLKQGYNGDLTSKQAGSIGGQMVNNICPVRRTEFVRTDRTSAKHSAPVIYEWAISF